MILIIALWLIIAVVIGVGASGRGRSGFGWFLLAVFLSPLIAGLLLLVLPDLRMHELLQGPQRATEVDDRQLQRNVESHGRPPIKLRWTLAAIMIPAVGLGVWLWLSQTVQPPTTTSAMIAASPPPTSPQQQKPTAHNGANAYLLSLDLAARAQTLGKVVGEGCSGKSTFYMGIGTSGFAKNEAFWSVRCQDGRTYAVETHPDGTSSVLECSVLKTMHAGECFKKLSN